MEAISEMGQDEGYLEHMASLLPTPRQMSRALGACELSPTRYCGCARQTKNTTTASGQDEGHTKYITKPQHHAHFCLWLYEQNPGKRNQEAEEMRSQADERQ